MKKWIAFLSVLFLLVSCSDEPAGPSATGGGSGSSTAESAGGSTTGTGDGSSTTGGSTTGSTTESDADTSTSSTDGGTSNETYQTGSLTAGDYDDQLNPSYYHDYASRYLQYMDSAQWQNYVDVAQHVAITVLDSEAKPYNGANISVKSNGNVLQTLKTPANGTVYVYPDFDSLPTTFELDVTDREGDAQQQANIDLSQLSDQREVNVRIPALSQASTELDLVLVIDTTGSMGDELGYLQAELTAILSQIQNKNPQTGINVGLVLYRDHGDEYVVKTHEFNGDISAVQDLLNGESYHGGGDYEEAMDEAMHAALALQWRDQSTKVLLLVADAPPHDNKVESAWEAAKQARTEQIHVVPLAASGVGDSAEYLMRGMAMLTHSRYLFLTDDSGYGNSHAEPSIPCYVVTRLDSLIVRVVNGYLSGERVEPAAEEIVREVGNYDNGSCN